VACAQNINLVGDNSLKNYSEAQLAQGTPAIQISETEWDFGSISADANLTHEFKFKNTGDGILVLKKLVPGCGTWVTFFNKAIPPGAEGKVTVKLNPRGCSQGGGKKWVLVTCNDPKNPYFSLWVQGHPNF
jgi:hypothetical protein